MEEAARRDNKACLPGRSFTVARLLGWVSWVCKPQKDFCGLSFFIISIVILPLAILSYITQRQESLIYFPDRKDPWPSVTCSSPRGNGQASGAGARGVLVPALCFPLLLLSCPSGWLTTENKCVQQAQAVRVTVLAPGTVAPDHHVTNIRPAGCGNRSVQSRLRLIQPIWLPNSCRERLGVRHRFFLSVLPLVTR